MLFQASEFSKLSYYDHRPWKKRQFSSVNPLEFLYFQIQYFVQQKFYNVE